MSTVLCTQSHTRHDDGTVTTWHVNRVPILTDPESHRAHIMLSDPEYSLTDNGHLVRIRPRRMNPDGSSDKPRDKFSYEGGNIPDPRPRHPTAADIHEIWWEEA